MTPSSSWGPPRGSSSSSRRKTRGRSSSTARTTSSCRSVSPEKSGSRDNPPTGFDYVKKPRRRANDPPPRLADSAHDANVGSLQPLRTAVDLEFDELAFGKRTEPLGLDRRLVTEDVLTGVLFDEAKALCVVEPLHSSSCHFLSLCSLFATSCRFLLRDDDYLRNWRRL